MELTKDGRVKEHLVSMFSAFYDLVDMAVKAGLVSNAIKADVGSEDIYRMLTGENHELEEYRKTGLTPEQMAEIDHLYSEKCVEVAKLAAKNELLEHQLKSLRSSIAGLAAVDDGK